MACVHFTDVHDEVGLAAAGLAQELDESAEELVLLARLLTSSSERAGVRRHLG